MAHLYGEFRAFKLDDRHLFFVGELPADLRLGEADFESTWCLHPQEYHEIKMHGRLVRTPRWQQAFGRDYRYTGRTNMALPVPARLEPISQWARSNVHERLNG